MAGTARLAIEAWAALLRAQATIARELEDADCWGDLLPREYGVLHILSTAPDGLRMTEILNDVLLTQPGMSRLVARLEQRGLVERRDDPDDARACRIHLTAAGAETYRRVGIAHARQVTRVMTRALDPKQLVILRDLSRTLIETAPARPTAAAARRVTPEH